MISTKVLFVCILIYITSVILLFQYNPTGHFDMGNAITVSMSVFGCIIIGMLIMMSYKNDIMFNDSGLNTRNVWSITKMSLVIFSGIALFIGIIFTIFHFVQYPTQSIAFFKVFNMLIVITTCLFFIYLIKDIKFNNPYVRFIQSVILYVPCLIYDFIDWVKYQYSITTPTSFIILGFDIAFILLNYLWKHALLFIKHNNKADLILLEDPVYLNQKHMLGTFEDLKASRKNKNYNYNYAVSFDIYINPQPPSTSSAYTEYSTLFDYGGKPTLLYKADENKLKIQMKMNNDTTENIYLGTDMKLQKWNTFLINYVGGTLDIFLNNILISSTGSLSPYMTLDVVTVGQTDGINGGIREVVYFRKPVL